MYKVKKAAIFGICGVSNTWLPKESKRFFRTDIFKSVLEEKGFEVVKEDNFYWSFEMPANPLPWRLFAITINYFNIKNSHKPYAQKVLNEAKKRLKKIAQDVDIVFIFAHSGGTIITQRLLLDADLDLAKTKLAPVMVAVPNQILYGWKWFNRLFAKAVTSEEVKQIKTKSVMITGTCDPLSGPEIPGLDQNPNIKHIGPIKPQSWFEYLPGIQHSRLMGPGYRGYLKEAVGILTKQGKTD